jgi:tRNA-dihydrouridine synthase A
VRRTALRAPISVAPMMDVTDRHTRWLYRRLSRRALLYTEMVTATALRHGDVPYLLGFDPSEHPIALQLGGDDPALLADAARLGAEWGYDEINLNVGCPSPRVQKGRFGACLMREPALVADLVRAMAGAAPVPITVKCRIGVDDHDRYEDLLAFAEAVAQAGVARLTVHARKAWLDGLSPRENRTIPPLRYDDVHRLKRALPGVPIEINGGVLDLDAAQAELAHVDAVMIGRAVWKDPYLLAQVDPRFFGDSSALPERADVARAFVAYADQAASGGARLQHVVRNLGPLYAGQPGSARFKRAVSAVHSDGTAGILRAIDEIEALRAAGPSPVGAHTAPA